MNKQTLCKLLASFSIYICYIAIVISYKASPIFFTISIFLLYAIDIPKYLFDPKNILFAYYGLFFTIPVMFAPRYAHNTFQSYEEKLAYILIFTTFFIGILVFSYMQNFIHTKKTTSSTGSICILKKLFFSFMLFSFLLCYLIMTSSTGISYWIENPGRAFLSREGSGIYNVLFIFSCMIFFPLSGYLTYKTKKKIYIFLGIICFLLFIPFIGGKGRSFIFLITTVSPFLYFNRFKIKYLFPSFSIFSLCFGIITFFRSGNYLTIDMLSGYILNYFSVYENLVVSIQDISPSHFKTMFLPFNKFLTPFGIQNNNIYYDMSNWLTDIYYPTHWSIRATEQWPIETDMYLSLWYIYSIPLLIVFFASIYYLFLKSIRLKQLGLIVASVNLNFYMISHLRGGLIIWTDFYFIPFLLVIIYMFRKYHV